MDITTYRSNRETNASYDTDRAVITLPDFGGEVDIRHENGRLVITSRSGPIAVHPFMSNRVEISIEETR